METHRKLGGNPDIDTSFQYLKFFLEDDEELAKIEKDYRAGKQGVNSLPLQKINLGELLTGEIKQKCIACLQELTKQHQERRALATPEKVQDYWAVRKLKYDFPDPPKSKLRR